METKYKICAELSHCHSELQFIILIPQILLHPPHKNLVHQQYDPLQSCLLWGEWDQSESM